MARALRQPLLPFARQNKNIDGAMYYSQMKEVVRLKAH